MRTLILLLMLPFAAVGQCDSIFKPHVDDMTGNVTKRHELILLDDIQIMVMPAGEDVALMFIVDGCVDTKKTYLLFSDSTRLELPQHGKYNCQGYATTYFGHKIWKTQAQEHTLRQKRIIKVRIEKSQGYVESEVSESDGELIRELFKCATL